MLPKLRNKLKRVFVSRLASGFMLAIVSAALVLSPFQISLTGANPVVNVAHAQTTPNTPTSDSQKCFIPDVNTGALQPTNCGGYQPGTQFTNGGAYNSKLQLVNKNGDVIDDFGCNLTSGNGLATCLSSLVYAVTVGLSAPFAYIGSSFLTIAVKVSLDSSSYAIGFIASGWTVARDFANMAFLFILIYIAFSMMLDIEDSGTMHTLSRVIMIALIVNFSFFMTRVVIDIGNIAAVQVYNAIPVDPNQCSGTIAKNADPACLFGAKDLTASIMGALNIQNLFSTREFQQWRSDKNQDSINIFITLSFLYIATAVMLSIIGFAFLAAGAQFLFRMATLWVLIIISPLAFTCYAIPSEEMHHLYHKWQDSLIRHAFYPAIFLFIFLILTLFLQGFKAGDGLLSSFFQTSTSPVGGAGIVGYLALLATKIAFMGLELAIIIILLKKALEAADDLGLQGAEWAHKFSENVGGALTWTQRWGYGKVYQQTVARSAGMAAKALDKTAIGHSFVGDVVRRDILKPISETTVPGTPTRSYAEWRELETERRETQEHIKHVNHLAEEAAHDPAHVSPEALRQIKDLTGHDLELLKPAQVQAMAQLLSTSQIDALMKSEHGFNTANKTAIRNEWKKKYTELAEMSAAGRLSDDDRARIKNLTRRELEELNDAQLESMASILTEAQVKAIGESDRYSNEARQRIRIAWHNGASSAPLSQARKAIAELRKVADDLERSGVSILELAKIGTERAPKAGVAINERSIKLMRQNTKDMIDAWRGGIESTRTEITSLLRSGVAAGDAQIKSRQEEIATSLANIRRAQDAITALGQLADKTKDVIAGAGDSKTAGEFLTKTDDGK